MAFLILVTPQLANAQAAILALIFGDKVATENFNLSMEIGFPINHFSNVDDLKRRNGINFGIAGNIKFSENWYLSPTVYFMSRRSVKLENTSLNTNDSYINSLYANTTAQMKINYTDIHALVTYQLSDSNFRFGLSPQVSFLSKARATYEGAEGDFTQNIDDFVNKTDFGLIANVGYFLRSGHQGKGIIFNVRYYHGFTDVLKDNFASGKNNSSYFAVHVSLPFITEELAAKNKKPSEINP